MSRLRWLCCGVCVVILVIVIVIWCWVWGCPFCRPCPSYPPTPPAPAANLILEDMHIAAWMPMDNGFVPSTSSAQPPGSVAVCRTEGASEEMKFGKCDGGYVDSDSTLQPGVLFQIGRIDRGDSKENDFGEVRLTRSDGSTVRLMAPERDGTTPADPATQFDWLDIYSVPAVNAQGSCVIDALQAYALFQGRRVLAPRENLVQTDCDGVTLSPAGTPLTCLRDRGIQAGLLPDLALVTYWPGSGDYKMTMRDGGHDFAYDFALQDRVRIDHWLEGCFVQRYEDVVKIEIKRRENSSYHQGFPHQPMNGGTLRVPAL